MKFYYLLPSIFFIFLLTEVRADVSSASASGHISDIPFKASIACGIPIGEKALSSLFSFKNKNTDNKEGKNIEISGQSLEGKRMIYTIITNKVKREILSNSFRVSNGVLTDSGVVSNKNTGTSYNYDFVIKCN